MSSSRDSSIKLLALQMTKSELFLPGIVLKVTSQKVRNLIMRLK
jgi:hypothetical protein